MVVTAREHLEEIIPELSQSPRLAVDIESNGFYAYREQVCLLQMSTVCGDYIIDPIAISDLSSLSPLFSNPRIEKIFHAGEYDVLCLKRDYGFKITHVFDTMIAGRLLGIKELGLAAAIERHFDVKLSKKLQRADWGKRPLTPAQITYAQLDTHFLIRLADIQRDLLKAKGRAEDAAEAFKDLERIEPVIKEFDPEGYWRIAGRDPISGRQTACLKEIYIYREEHAQARNRALFRVMPDDLMLRVARAMPQTMQELGVIKGMTPYLLQKLGNGLLRAVQRGREAQPLTAPPKPPRPRKDLKEWKLFEALRQWRKLRAEEEGVEPVVILSSKCLREIVHHAMENSADALRGLSELKRRRYGEQLAKILKAE